MRSLLFSCSSASLALALAACSTTAASSASGIGGAMLTTSLSVHVEGERDGAPIAGASVDVGGAVAATDAHGDATLTTTSGPVTLRVSAAGFVTERWIGVDRDHATVSLVTPLAARTLTGTITGGHADSVVSVATAITMLRTSSPLASTSSCAGGACDVTLTVETRAPALDVVLVEASAARLAEGVALDGAGHFALDAAAIEESARLVTLDVTLPSAPGLEAVVGVPGVASASGVVLFPALTPVAASLSAPALEGALAGDRLWYVARAANADGSGVSMIFDRQVGADGAVQLPSAFLAIPSVTPTASIGIAVDPEVDLYVVEVYSGDTAERVLVLRPRGARVDVPVELTGVSRVVVRAVDTLAQPGAIDLDAAEASATRIATVEL